MAAPRSVVIGPNSPIAQEFDDAPAYFEHCYFSAAAAADPRNDTDGGGVGEPCSHDHRPDDRNWPIWFHAGKPDGLGWADPGLSADDDYCRIARSRLASGECEEMECRWSTRPLSSSNRGSLLIACIRVDGSARNCPSGDCVPLCLALS